MENKVCPYCNNIDKVIFPERVQDSVDGVFGNGHFQTLHTAADINYNDNVLRRGGSLDIPVTEREDFLRRWPRTLLDQGMEGNAKCLLIIKVTNLGLGLGIISNIHNIFVIIFLSTMWNAVILKCFSISLLQLILHER